MVSKLSHFYKYHTVANGENLSVIASKYGLASWVTLYEANRQTILLSIKTKEEEYLQAVESLNAASSEAVKYRKTEVQNIVTEYKTITDKYYNTGL